MMFNPWHPSTDEIREWAYDPEALEPEQDWDLILAAERHEKLYLDLASDEVCPNRQYFLDILYLIVGDAVRTDYRVLAQYHVDGFLQRAEAYSHPDIRLWCERARYLMAHPATFDYESWCAGGLARIPRA